MSFLGSFDYINPITAIPRLMEDEYQNRTNQDQRQKEQQRGADASAQRVADLKRRQSQLASDFSANKEKYRGFLEDQNVKPLRMQMSQKLADTKLDASRRGLLGSGIEQRNKANVVSQYKSDYGTALDTAKGQISNLESDIMEAPIKTGLELGGLQGNAQEDYYRAALAEMQGRNSALSGLGSAIGQGTGTYLANRNKGGY